MIAQDPPASWSAAQIHQILRWAADGDLDARQVQQLQALAPLQPAPAAWLLEGRRFCLWAAVVLLAAAVIFFFAANWEHWSRFGKFALAAAAVCVCVFAAWRSAPGRRAWQASLLGAALCTGALLALIGQTYQTGADIWELFFAWSALMLPFVLLARAWPNWALWLLVSDLALGRGLTLDVLLPWLPPGGEHVQILLWLGFHLLCWWGCVRHAGRMLAHPTPHPQRLAGGLLLVSSLLFAVFGIFDPDRYGIYLPLFGLLAAGAFHHYRHVRLDIPMLGTLGACLIIAGGSLLGRMLAGIELLFQAPLMTAFAIWSIARLVRWLQNLRRLPDA